MKICKPNYSKAEVWAGKYACSVLHSIQKNQGCYNIFFHWIDAPAQKAIWKFQLWSQPQGLVFNLSTPESEDSNPSK